MCGICGIVGERNEGLIRRMTNLMVHRGPDDEGYYLDDGVSLGVRRLAIIDLETGHQPISNETETVWTILNGEIYNFQEIREDLKTRGHRFRTKTDTEVIVHAYEEYGYDCLKHFRGMFAFAIWDKNNKLLFLARDRIGIKPLYYTEYNGRLLFASEIKSILEYNGVPRKMDYTSLDLYLTLQYVPAPRTMFEGIKKLNPGEYLIFKDGKRRIERYWDIPYPSGEVKYNPEEVKERIDELIRESVKYRLISDVPLGVLLSGGVDSSAILAYASMLSKQRINTFTIGFGGEGKRFNERQFAREVAKIFNTNHKEFTIIPEVISILPKLIWHMDEPIADQAALPVYYLCKTAKDFVTVLLTGEGGDELFAGCPRYILSRLGLVLKKLPPNLREEFFSFLKGLSFIPDRVRNVSGRFEKLTPDLLLTNIKWVSNFDDDEKKRLLKSEFLEKDNLQDILKDAKDKKGFKNWLDELLYFDLKNWLVDDILMKVDKMSMATSIEARVPLLDHKLVEYVVGLPQEFKLKGFKTKYIFKEILKEYLPSKVLSRRKQTFRIPSMEWIRDEWKHLLKFHLLEKSSSLKGIINTEYMEELVINHLSGREENSQKLWNLLCLDIWHKIFIEGIKESEFLYHRRSKVHGFNNQILFAFDFPPEKGGIQSLLYSVYSPLLKKCLVIAPGAGDTSRFDLLQENTIYRAGSKKETTFMGYNILLTLFSMLLTGFKKFTRFEPRVIHCGHIRSAPIGYLFKFFFNTPYIVWTYALEITNKKYKKVFSFLLRNADAVITISEWTKRSLIDLGVDKEKIKIIHPPVHARFLNKNFEMRSAKEYIRQKLALREGEIILTVGRLSQLQKYKGIDKVIEALEKVKKEIQDFYYIVCGEGPLKEYYLALAKKKGLSSNVIIVSDATDEELLYYYNACDLFIMVSREEDSPKGRLAEGFGIVFLEANACGKPVIGGRSGGIPDAVIDGETGILVDPNNVDEIADAIVRLLTDEELAKRLGTQGRERVLREFTVDVAVKKLKEVIREVEKYPPSSPLTKGGKERG